MPVELLYGLGRWKVGAASQSPGLGHCLDQEQGRLRNSICAEGGMSLGLGEGKWECVRKSSCRNSPSGSEGRGEL